MFRFQQASSAIVSASVVALAACSANARPASELETPPARTAPRQEAITKPPSDASDREGCAFASAETGMTITSGVCLGIERPKGHEPPSSDHFRLALVSRSPSIESGADGVFSLTIANVSPNQQVFEIDAGAWPGASAHRVFDDRGNQVGVGQWDQCDDGSVDGYGGLIGVEPDADPKTVFVQLAPNGRVSVDLRIRAEVYGGGAWDAGTESSCPRAVGVVGRMWGGRYIIKARIAVDIASLPSIEAPLVVKGPRHPPLPASCRTPTTRNAIAAGLAPDECRTRQSRDSD